MYYIIRGIPEQRFKTDVEAKDWAWKVEGLHYPYLILVDPAKLLEQIVGVIEDLVDNHENYDLQKTLQSMMADLREYGIKTPEDLQNPLWNPVADGDSISIYERQRRDEAALRAWNRMAEETA